MLTSFDTDRSQLGRWTLRFSSDAEYWSGPRGATSVRCYLPFDGYGREIDMRVKYDWVKGSTLVLCLTLLEAVPRHGDILGAPG